jgi:hypothetical protein
MTCWESMLGCPICGQRTLLGCLDRDFRIGRFRCYRCWRREMEKREAFNEGLPPEEREEIVPWPVASPDPHEGLRMWCHDCGSRRLYAYITINDTRRGWVEFEALDNGELDTISGLQEDDCWMKSGDDLAQCAACGKTTTVREASRGW